MPMGGSAKWPTTFAVYLGTGRIPSYAAAVASVAFESGEAGHYVANLTGLAGGVTYAVGVRAGNACGYEQNTRSVAVTAATTGPAAVNALVATAIV